MKHEENEKLSSLLFYITEKIIKLESTNADLLEACENLENDNGAIPKHAWDMVQEAIKKAK